MLGYSIILWYSYCLVTICFYMIVFAHCELFYTACNHNFLNCQSHHDSYPFTSHFLHSNIKLRPSDFLVQKVSEILEANSVDCFVPIWRMKFLKFWNETIHGICFQDFTYFWYKEIRWKQLNVWMQKVNIQNEVVQRKIFDPAARLVYKYSRNNIAESWVSA